jgi:6-phosphofructokinase 1
VSADVKNGKTALYNRLEGNDEDYILVDIVRNAGKKGHKCEAFVRGGPREIAHFEPTTVRAAIVTCGGLCPGLNNVIRELVDCLYRLYNVSSVVGVM